MGTVMNGNEWSGVCVNGNIVNGLVKNGAVFYKKTGQGYFLVEYTDTNNTDYEVQFENETSLKNFTSANSNLKTCKITVLGNAVLTNVNGLFNFCLNLTNLKLNNFDTSNITDMRNMFAFCQSLINLDLSNFDTNNVTLMGSMFNGCLKISILNLSNFSFDNVTNANSMFAGVPANCLITVKDQAAKDFVLGVRSDLTNVVIAQ